ncbi:MAG: hypothetical protein KZQ78_06990 [Candidatus Thiodiazotropha sp. (ex Ustalcina ferruginea)]|nr:hypothetical protein [Candidatus Thiodiazotropha sp. (ex Ustalcina ferruginea)]
MCDGRWILAGLLLISVTSLVAWDKTDLDHFLVTGECNGYDLEGARFDHGVRYGPFPAKDGFGCASRR